MSALILISMISCEIDQNSLLTNGIWDFQNLTTDSEDETIKGFVALGKALLTDATLEFQPAGTYIIDSPLLDEPINGSWTLVGDDQLIMTPEGDIPETANIETLSKKKLSYIQTFTDTNLNTYSITTTWVRE